MLLLSCCSDRAWSDAGINLAVQTELVKETNATLNNCSYEFRKKRVLTQQLFGKIYSRSNGCETSLNDPPHPSPGLVCPTTLLPKACRLRGACTPAAAASAEPIFRAKFELSEQKLDVDRRDICMRAA